MRPSHLAGLIFFVSVSLFGASSTFADNFKILSVPGSTSTEAEGINNFGIVVGWFGAGSPTTQNAFVYQGGVYTTLDPPGSTGSIAYGINDSGTIVGEAFYSSGAQGFIYSGGHYTFVSAPGDANTIFQSINDAGEIVGWGYGPGTTTGFIDMGGVFSPLACPGFVNSALQGVNNGGSVTGLCSNPSSSANFIFERSAFQFLPRLGNGQVALGINNSDDVVGYFQPSGQVIQDGFLFNGTTYRTISLSSDQPTVATDLNDEGVVVGFSNTVGFVDTLPEPGEVLLLGLGLFVVAFRKAVASTQRRRFKISC